MAPADMLAANARGIIVLLAGQSAIERAFPGRSILSVVESKRDPRRYKMHAGFRGYCWVECDEGAAGGS